MREEEFDKRLEKLERRTKRIWFLVIYMAVVGLMLIPFNILVVPPMMLMTLMIGLIIIMLDKREW